MKAVNDHGMDADLARKANAKYDTKKEAEARAWIEKVLKIKLAGNFGEAIQNGVVLCDLIRKISPKCVRAPYTGGTSKFKEMENVSSFIQYARSIGVPDHSNMTTVALYELKDMGQVLNCIHVFGGYLQKAVPGYKGAGRVVVWMCWCGVEGEGARACVGEVARAWVMYFASTFATQETQRLGGAPHLQPGLSSKLPSSVALIDRPAAIAFFR